MRNEVGKSLLQQPAYNAMFKISQHLFEKSIRPDRILDGLRFHSISTLCSEVRHYVKYSYWRNGLDTVGGRRSCWPSRERAATVPLLCMLPCYRIFLPEIVRCCSVDNYIVILDFP